VSWPNTEAIGKFGNRGFIQKAFLDKTHTALPPSLQFHSTPGFLVPSRGGSEGMAGSPPAPRLPPNQRTRHSPNGPVAPDKLDDSRSG
jgi:hypothetical protein